MKHQATAKSRSAEPAPPVLAELDTPPTAVLRLNRPDRLNAVSLELYEQLVQALEAIDADERFRVVVITGEGRAFCVGADLKSHGEGDPDPEIRLRYVETGQAVYRLLQELRVPVVAAVNGHAIGAGLELALSCDIIVVNEDAKLRFPEIALGTFIGGGTVYTLAQRVGLAKAKELIMLGEFFLGADAQAFGLANRAVPAAEVWDHSMQFAEALAAQAPKSLAFAKQLLRRAQRVDYDTAMALEADALLSCMTTNDWHEGIEAFHEKRSPKFTGT
jgi:enoyl-CoA hydratase